MKEPRYNFYPFIKFDRFEYANSEPVLNCVLSPAINPQKAVA